MNTFNRWYDSLSEPWRFLIFFIPMATVLILFSIKSTMVIGGIGLSIIGLMAAYRAIRMGGMHVVIGNVLLALLAIILVSVLVMKSI